MLHAELAEYERVTVIVKLEYCQPITGRRTELVNFNNSRHCQSAWEAGTGFEGSLGEEADGSRWARRGVLVPWPGGASRALRVSSVEWGLCLQISAERQICSTVAMAVTLGATVVFGQPYARHRKEFRAV